MTFTLLAYDADSRAWGGVAATGNLSVGGWVLRGKAGVGLSASQGYSPSTIWGDDALTAMEQGHSAPQAVAGVVNADPGKAWRQLAALDGSGQAAAFSGEANSEFKGHLVREGLVASGNILAGPHVLDAMADALEKARTPFENRLLAALEAGRRAGGDERGVQSAAMLVVSENAPPLDLRIDWHETPIVALGQLLEKTRRPDYRDWLKIIPTASDPHRCPDMKSRTVSA